MITGWFCQVNCLVIMSLFDWWPFRFFRYNFSDCAFFELNIYVFLKALNLIHFGHILQVFRNIFIAGQRTHKILVQIHYCILESFLQHNSPIINEAISTVQSSTIAKIIILCLKQWFHFLMYITLLEVFQNQSKWFIEIPRKYFFIQ